MYPGLAASQPLGRPGDDRERGPEVVGDRREEVLLQRIELPEAIRHAIERDREVGDLVTPPHRDGLGRLAPRDVRRRGLKLP